MPEVEGHRGKLGQVEAVNKKSRSLAGRKSEPTLIDHERLKSNELEEQRGVRMLQHAAVLAHVLETEKGQVGLLLVGLAKRPQAAPLGARRVRHYRMRPLIRPGVPRRVVRLHVGHLVVLASSTHAERGYGPRRVFSTHC